MPENRGYQGQQQNRTYCRSTTKPPGGPQKNHDATEDQEWQVSQPRQPEVVEIGVVLEQDLVAIGGDIIKRLGARAAQIWAKRNRDASKGRVLWFVGVGSSVQPFHSIGNVQGLVKSGGKDRVSREDPNGGYCD
jgi:hypothetical protein